MPRAKATDTTNEIALKKPRAPRKRTPRVKDDAIASTSPAVAIETTSSGRKAPTQVAEVKNVDHKKSRGIKRVFVILVLLLVGMGASIGIGFSGEGEIDVSAKIAARNEQIARGQVTSQTGETITRTIPVQNTSSVANGGLTPSAVVPEPEVAPPQATSTESASTTTASSSPITTSTSTTETNLPDAEDSTIASPQE